MNEMDNIVMELAAEMLRELGYDAVVNSHGYVHIRLGPNDDWAGAQEDFEMALHHAEDSM